MAKKHQVIKDVYFREGAMDRSMGRSKASTQYGNETPMGKKWKRGWEYMNEVIEKALEGTE